MAKQTTTQAAPQANMVTPGSEFEGTLRTDDNIRVGGKVKGSLHAGGKVIVAPEGRVEGDVHADVADVAGHVKGDLRIKTRLLLTSTARVEGTITTGRLIVEEGAEFDGECTMGRLKASGENALNLKKAALESANA